MTDSGKRRYRRAADTRQLIIRTAARLFYLEGIRAVGIDRVAAEADVTTATLYRLFGSKDDLAVEYLRLADHEWFDWLDETTVDGPAAMPQFFDQLDERAAQPGYRGCPFRLALAEFPDTDSAVHRIASDNKQRTRQRFLKIATCAGVAEREQVADQLMVIMEGICASSGDRAISPPSDVASSMVAGLLVSPERMAGRPGAAVAAASERSPVNVRPGVDRRPAPPTASS